MKEIKLKPCPFCGGIARPWVKGRGWRMAMVSCSECGASTAMLGSRDAAAEAWNRRAGEEGR